MMSSHNDSFVASGNSPTDSASKIQPDFVVENHGIFFLKPLTPAAISWVEDHIGRENGYQPYWPIVLIEHSFITDVVSGILRGGLVCR
jgi:hypothetical protein